MMTPGMPETLPALCGQCGQGETRDRAGNYLSDVRITRDALGFPWCAEHANRGQLVDLGASLGFPQVDCEIAAIGPGAYCWSVLAICAPDDLVWMLIDVIESGDAIEIEDIPEEQERTGDVA